MTNTAAVRELLNRIDHQPIGDYAIVGDCHTAALISRSGSLDWLCLPEFSSPSLFGALLDRRCGGRLLIAPRAVVAIERQYLGHSAVLETTYHCVDGILIVTDFMAMPSHQDCRILVRRLDCRAGRVMIDVACEPRPDYARSPAQLAPIPTGWMLNLAQQPDRAAVVRLESDLPLALAESGDWLGGSTELWAGDQRTVAVSHRPDTKPCSMLAECGRLLTQTQHWWETWCESCRYEGPYLESVVRSCITLKLLSHQRSGAVIAALTTSLPESLEGGRNWDYRYCWLRDTSLLLQSFLDMGFTDESADFIRWLLDIAHRPHLQPMYDLDGNTVPEETCLDHLEGWRGCQPVLIGNAANRQFQLDIYGQLVETIYRYVQSGATLTPEEEQLLLDLGEQVLKCWRGPDEGIWETRGEPRHHTYSKLMCWVALDRLLKLDETVGLGKGCSDALRRTCAEIRQIIDTEGFHSERKCFVGYFGGDMPDASLLLMLRYGYAEADDPRIQATFKDIMTRLSVNGMLYRYPQSADYDGVPGSENLFLVCNFWAVDHLARSGRIDDAVRMYEHLLGLANDVGLFAEEVDQYSGGALGNFPQAYSHAGVVTAAIAIAQARARASTP